MGLVFQSKGKIKDSNLDLYESISLFLINPRDVFFIKPRWIFSLLNNTWSVHAIYIYNKKYKEGRVAKINAKDSTKIFDLLKIEVKTKKGFKNNSKTDYRNPHFNNEDKDQPVCIE